MDLCNHGGFCRRLAGHSGGHTRDPAPSTLHWDERREEIMNKHIDVAVTLWALDFKTPPWADLGDHDTPHP